MKEAKRYADRIPSPVGDIWAVVDSDGVLVQLDFEGGRCAPADEADLTRQQAELGFELVYSAERLGEVARALRRYFDGSNRKLDLAVAPDGTDFQQLVWRELQRIPWGETVSYGELARRVGRPGAARAVGRANATNPISLVIPCHRVIGASGALTGYGGGMDRKKALLELEGALSGSLFG